MPLDLEAAALQRQRDRIIAFKTPLARIMREFYGFFLDLMRNQIEGLNPHGTVPQFFVPTSVEVIANQPEDSVSESVPH